MNLIVAFFGTILFFLPGFLITFLFLRKLSLLDLISYTIIFSASFSVMLIFLLYSTGIGGLYQVLLFYFISCIILFIAVLIRKKGLIVTKDPKLFFYLLGVSVFGTLWRWLFRIQGSRWLHNVNFSYFFPIDKIFYSGVKFVTLPNIGFYTGMEVSHSTLIAGDLSWFFYSVIGFKGIFETLVIVFLTCYFTYKVINLYRKDSKLALLGALIMALGPIEIWQNTFSFLGTDLTYVAFISLFILFKENSRRSFYVALALMITIAFSYYTATLAFLITSVGFLLSIFLVDLIIEKKEFKTSLRSFVRDKKTHRYLIILLLLTFLLISVTGKPLVNYTLDTASGVASSIIGNLPVSDSSLTIATLKSPLSPKYVFFHFTPIEWQDIFLLLLGLTFLISQFRKSKIGSKISEEDKHIFMAFLPAYMVAISFSLVNYLQRSFSYCLFFIILISNIPKKIFFYFAFFATVFFLLSGYFVNLPIANGLSVSSQDLSGAQWVSENLHGRILSDANFIGLLVREGYYNVTGFTDNSQYSTLFYYQTNVTLIKKAFSSLGIDYFVTTEKMRNDFIIMLNFAQNPMSNSQIYEENFKKIYDNDGVYVYSVSKDNPKLSYARPINLN